MGYQYWYYSVKLINSTVFPTFRRIVDHKSNRRVSRKCCRIVCNKQSLYMSIAVIFSYLWLIDFKAKFEYEALSIVLFEIDHVLKLSRLAQLALPYMTFTVVFCHFRCSIQWCVMTELSCHGYTLQPLFVTMVNTTHLSSIIPNSRSGYTSMTPLLDR